MEVNILAFIATALFILVFTAFLLIIYVKMGYENSQEAIGRIVCANCYLANKSVNIEIPQMVLFDTVFEAVVRIPYNMRIKQFLANDKKF
ncbi:hypothetical protein AHAS_Ahas19G0278100 [Arachis hypogaea]